MGKSQKNLYHFFLYIKEKKRKKKAKLALPMPDLNSGPWLSWKKYKSFHPNALGLSLIFWRHAACVNFFYMKYA